MLVLLWVAMFLVCRCFIGVRLFIIFEYYWWNMFFWLVRLKFSMLTITLIGSYVVNAVIRLSGGVVLKCLMSVLMVWLMVGVKVLRCFRMCFLVLFWMIRL